MSSTNDDYTSVTDTVVKKKPGFTRRCATSKLHAKWSCSLDAQLIHGSRVRKKVREKLWSLSGSSGRYRRTQARYCEDCISQVKKLFPFDVGVVVSRPVAVAVKPPPKPQMVSQTVPYAGDHTYAQNKDGKVAAIIEMIDELSRRERAQVALYLANLERSTSRVVGKNWKQRNITVS